MGVLVCSRTTCNNIMCDRYSHKYGYICDECFKELVSVGKTTDIYEFLDSQKHENVNDSEIYFDEIFPEVDNG